MGQLRESDSEKHDVMISIEGRVPGWLENKCETFTFNCSLRTNMNQPIGLWHEHVYHL